MRKLGVLGLFVLMLVLVGCSSNASGGKVKVEVAVDSASFVLLGDYGETIDLESEKTPLAVTLNVKNTSDSTVSVSTYSDILVYDGDQQLPLETSFNSKLGFDTMPNDDIGAGKTKNITILFSAEKNKQYEISVKPFVIGSSNEEKEVIVPIDTTEYVESFENLNDPGKALVAYIDTIYMDKENVDYEKLVTADKQALQDKAFNTFKDSLNKAFYDLDISTEEATKQYDIYKTTIAQKATIDAVTTGNANGKAIVTLEYSSIPLTNLYDKVNDYRKEYLDNTGDYDGEKRDEYAYSKLDTIINSLEPKHGKHNLNIEMIEKDGKWTINLADDYNSQELVRVFAEGKIY